MPRKRIRLEIRGIMAAVAVSALILCVYRVDVAPSVSVVLILGSISVLAYKRYSDALAQRLIEEQLTTRSRKITLLLRAVTVAVTLIGLSDAAFLAGFLGYPVLIAALARLSQHSEPTQLVIGAVFGSIMALIVASALKRKILPILDEPLPPAASRSEE